MLTTTELSNILLILKGGKGMERFRFAFTGFDGEKITMSWDLTKYCNQTEEGWSIWMNGDEAIVFVEGLTAA